MAQPDEDVHGKVTTTKDLKAKAPEDGATAAGSRDETHDSVDAATGALLNPEAHIAFHQAEAPVAPLPPVGAADDDPAAASGVEPPGAAAGKSAGKPKPGDKDYDPLRK